MLLSLREYHSKVMGNSQSRMLINEQQISADQESGSLKRTEQFEDFEIIRPVVVTGFGKIYPDEPSDESNFSWSVVEKLSETITDNLGKEIPIIKGKPSKDDKSIPEPVQVCYHYVDNPCFKEWLDSTDALVYLHLGVSGIGSKNVVQLETTGKRKGVHFKRDHYPHDNVGDNIDTPQYLTPDGEDPPHTSFQVSTLCQNLKTHKSEISVATTCSEKTIQLSYRSSDDAGTFLCDYLYYTSLDLATERNRCGDTSFPRNVLFVHIPDTLCLQDEGELACYSNCKSEKAEALAGVIEFIIKELLAKIEAPNDR